MNLFHEKLLNVWMPRIIRILSWVPFVNRYLPTNQALIDSTYSDSTSPSRISVSHTNNISMKQGMQYEVLRDGTFDFNNAEQIDLSEEGSQMEESE